MMMGNKWAVEAEDWRPLKKRKKEIEGKNEELEKGLWEEDKAKESVEGKFWGFKVPYL